MVAAPSRHDDVGPSGAGFVVGDFRIWIRKGKDDGVVGHGLDHFCRNQSPLAQAQKHIGALERISYGIESLLCGITRFCLIQPFPAGMDVPLAVEHRHILAAQSQLLINVHTTHCRSTCT